MKRIATGIAALALVAAAAAPASAGTNVWSMNFESGGFFDNVGPFPSASRIVATGGATIQGAQSLPGFGANFLRNDTSGVTRFIVEGLGAHTALELSFDLAFLDSWDGNLPDGNCCSPDDLGLSIDGLSPFDFSWNGGNPGSPTNFGPGMVVGTGHFGFNADWQDAVVHYSFLIPHTAADWRIQISAGGAGFQGGLDESWGIDNFRLAAVTGGVPEPATWAMMILGFGFAGAALRRRRSVPA